jgi:hypothetical protein
MCEYEDGAHCAMLHLQRKPAMRHRVPMVIPGGVRVVPGISAGDPQNRPQLHRITAQKKTPAQGGR